MLIHLDNLTQIYLAFSDILSAEMVVPKKAFELVAGADVDRSPSGRSFGGEHIGMEVSKEEQLRRRLADGESVLTEREVEVLAHLDQGRHTRDIAEQMFVANTTVRTHIRNAMRALEVHSRRSAVRLARQVGLLDERSLPRG